MLKPPLTADTLDQLGVEEGERSGPISLMFSGGIDSTTAALALARTHSKVHLLTYKNGYSHRHQERTRDRVRELQRRAGDRFVHTLTSTKDLFDRFLVDDVAREFRKYRSGFIWCLGCKMAMHTRSVLYNLEHDIPYMADGSSSSTGEMVEQTLLALYLFREFYGEYGIEFQTPVYTIPREEEIKYLRRKGFRMGIRVKDRFLGVQPTCRAGEIYYLSFLLLDQPPRHDDEKVQRFLRERRAMAREVIEAYCKERGVPTRVGWSRLSAGA